MKKIIVGILAMGLLVFGVGLAAAQDAELEPWACPEGFAGQTLNIYNWGTYIDEEAIPNFEALCEVEVTYTIYNSNDEMIARLRQGNPGFDIVVPAGSSIPVMVAADLLLPIDVDAIPNFEHISEGLRDQAFDPGNEYTVPYQWGTVGIAYNAEAVTEAITSWEDLFNYDGNVAWLDDNRAMLGVALQLLGYDANTTDEDEIAAARDFLIENGGNVVRIADDDGQEMLIRGEADVVVEYNGDIFQILIDCECEDYVWVTPELGTNIWMDNLAIPTDAPNVELARVFIDYMLHPSIGAANSNYIAYASPNQTAIDLGLIDEEQLNNSAIYPDAELIETMFAVLEDPEVEQLYSDAWDEISILVGG